MVDVRRWVRSFLVDPTDRFGLLLGLLVTTFLVTGLSSSGEIRLSAGILNLLSLIVGVRSTRMREKHQVLSALVIMGVTGSILLWLLPFDGIGAALGATMQVVVLGALTLAVLARVISHSQVTVQTILGAIAAYFLLGQIFAWIYLALSGYVDDALFSPPATGELPTYYSYVVLTTLGFGDIVPTNTISERVTVVEALTGQLFLATLVARLVSLYARPQSSDVPVES